MRGPSLFAFLSFTDNNGEGLADQELEPILFIKALNRIERVLFRDGREAIEQNRVFANNLAELQFDFRTDRRHSVVGAQRDEDFVAHARGLDDQPSRLAQLQFAAQGGDHADTWMLTTLR